MTKDKKPPISQNISGSKSRSGKTSNTKKDRKSRPSERSNISSHRDKTGSTMRDKPRSSERSTMSSPGGKTGSTTRDKIPRSSDRSSVFSPGGKTGSTTTDKIPRSSDRSSVFSPGGKTGSTTTDKIPRSSDRSSVFSPGGKTGSTTTGKIPRSSVRPSVFSPGGQTGSTTRYTIPRLSERSNMSSPADKTGSTRIDIVRRSSEITIISSPGDKTGRTARDKTPRSSERSIVSAGVKTGVSINNYRQDSKYHHCTLLGEPRDVVTKFIDGGLFVHVRRSIRRFMMISSKHPYTKYYAPSICRLKDEERRHLIWHYNTIHPLSMFSFYFNMIMFFTIIVMILASPIGVMVFRGQRDILYIFFFPATVANLMLIALSFCTGYYDINRNIVVMKRSAIAINYIKTYLIFDLLAVIPQILRGNIAALAGLVWSVKKNQVVKVLSPILITIRFARYFWCLNILQEIRLFYGMSTYTYRIIKLIMNSLTIIITSTYIMFIILNELPSHMDHSLLKHIEHTVMALMMVSYGHPVFKQVQERICPIVFIVIGFVLHLIMLTEGMEIWLKFFSVENKQTSVYNSTNAYIRYRALPMTLRKRISLFLDFKYQGYFYKESVIRKATSNALKREILITITRESIQKVELFVKCPGLVLNKIRANLISEIFLPGDVIIKAGARGHCMFFILAGTVVVTSPEDKEMCYLRDGAHFGEVALVVSMSRVANVIAVTPCELFKLDRVHFWDVMKNYPQLASEIRSMATDRLAKTSSSIDNALVREKTMSSTLVDEHEEKSLDLITVQMSQADVDSSLSTIDIQK